MWSTENLTKSDGTKHGERHKLKKGFWFPGNDSVKVEYCFQYKDGDIDGETGAAVDAGKVGKSKGMYTIAKERCLLNPVESESIIRVTAAELQKRLAQQPDFQCESSALHEVLREFQTKCVMTPKFHPGDGALPRV